ncbi:hypothetical protein OIE61_39610 [Streptomyces sp. NBC_01762]|uniref:GNAT family N-acetyltransferase n=1 Tax=unclassified Streptomyces TaxID=2593676 RepID=UPI002DDB8FD8|nr:MULTISPECIES: GNAT family N-acetyltransferase [unclassified Streptomyces]WSC49535.1 hypothetical protein OIE61_39610 [Streptomyces sp. NBC_01762]WSD29107.1 hypothetical protein OHA26_39925 [Streptomyces sp. NBC_01751]
MFRRPRRPWRSARTAGRSPTGGRSVAINGQIVGLAHSDQDLVEFLKRAGPDDAWDLLRLWADHELAEPSMFVNKLTVARMHAGQDLGGRLLDWAGDRAHRSGAAWLRLDAWTTNEALQQYYLRHGFKHVRTVTEGGAVNGGPRVSGWLAQRPARAAQDHGLTDLAQPCRPL